MGARTDGDEYDIAIVGGGPAGLAAAVGAGRMNRRAICFEAGTPRTARAPRYFNYLGFPEGIPGEELLERGRQQAARWGAALVDSAVTEVSAVEGGPPGFRLAGTGGAWRARGVVFATGVVDRQPGCGNLYGGTGAGVHYCVVCDGCEVRGETVAVIGGGHHAVETLEALRDFTSDLHLLVDGLSVLRKDDQERLAEWGVHVHPSRLLDFRFEEDGIRFDCEEELPAFPHVFVAAGVEPHNEVAAALGCALDEDGYIMTDERQATSVPFVYAAGDCDGGHKQVTQAMAEGEMAALELAKRLREAGFPAVD